MKVPYYNGDPRIRRDPNSENRPFTCGPKRLTRFKELNIDLGAEKNLGAELLHFKLLGFRV